MGLRFRKSIKLGGGARLNISKSGIGYSVGTKGLRLTKKAGGGTRSTLSVPGTGISYVKDHGSGKGSKKQKNIKCNEDLSDPDHGNNDSDKPPKRKTWLWILGWIFIFPLPLTILILRNKEQRSLLKYAIAAAAWIIYVFIGLSAGSGAGTEAQETVRTTVVTETTEQSTESTIDVESISFEEFSKELVLGETLQITADVLPGNAEDRTISWSSSNDAVATVDQSGNVTAVGDGDVQITAAAVNGIRATADLTVDGSKRLMNLSVKRTRQDKNNIGDEWSFQSEINGEQTTQEYTVSAGDTLNFYTKITESDDNPDIGEASGSYTVTEEDMKNGFEISMDVYVTENGGRNSGKSAYFTVTYYFSIS